MIDIGVPWWPVFCLLCSLIAFEKVHQVLCNLRRKLHFCVSSGCIIL